MSNTFCLFASSLSCYTYVSICLLILFKINQSRNDHVNFSSSHLIAMCKKPLANFQLQVDKQKPWHWTCDFIVIMLYTQRRVHWHFDPHRPLPETVRFLTISPQALQNVNHFDAFHCKHWDVEMPVTHFLEQHTDGSHISFELFLSESARERRWTNCSQRWILSKYMRTWAHGTHRAVNKVSCHCFIHNVWPEGNHGLCEEHPFSQFSLIHTCICFII